MEGNTGDFTIHRNGSLTATIGGNALISGYQFITGTNFIGHNTTLSGTGQIATIKTSNPIQDQAGNEYYPDITPATVRNYTRNNTTTPSSWDDNGMQDAIQFGRHIIPSEDSKYDLGATGPAPRRWNQLFVNSIYMSGDTLEAGVVKAIKLDETGNVAIPPGTTIGGVNPGTIVIKGNVATPADLPLSLIHI